MEGSHICQGRVCHGVYWGQRMTFGRWFSSTILRFAWEALLPTYASHQPSVTVILAGSMCMTHLQWSQVVSHDYFSFITFVFLKLVILLAFFKALVCSSTSNPFWIHHVSWNETISPLNSVAFPESLEMVLQSWLLVPHLEYSAVLELPIFSFLESPLATFYFLNVLHGDSFSLYLSFPHSRNLDWPWTIKVIEDNLDLLIILIPPCVLGL